MVEAVVGVGTVELLVYRDREGRWCARAESGPRTVWVTVMDERWNQNQLAAEVAMMGIAHGEDAVGMVDWGDEPVKMTIRDNILS